MYNSKYEQKINMEIYYEGLQPMLIAMYVYCFNHHYQKIDINVKNLYLFNKHTTCELDQHKCLLLLGGSRQKLMSKK